MANADRKKVLKSLEREFAPGEVIFREGEETRELYILLSGTVEISKNGRVLARVSEGDTYLGEMSTLLGTPRTATVRAHDACRCIRVPENKVSDFFAHSPALGIKLAKVLAQRLQEMNVKYERLLAGMAEQEEEARERFRELTSGSYRRAMLALYRERAGTRMPIREVVDRTRIPLSEINRVLLLFIDAGLVRVDDRDLLFLQCGNPALRRLIMEWRP